MSLEPLKPIIKVLTGQEPSKAWQRKLRFFQLKYWLVRKGEMAIEVDRAGGAFTAAYTSSWLEKEGQTGSSAIVNCFRDPICASLADEFFDCSDPFSWLHGSVRLAIVKKSWDKRQSAIKAIGRLTNIRLRLAQTPSCAGLDYNLAMKIYQNDPVQRLARTTLSNAYRKLGMRIPFLYVAENSFQSLFDIESDPDDLLQISIRTVFPGEAALSFFQRVVFVAEALKEPWAGELKELVGGKSEHIKDLTPYELDEVKGFLPSPRRSALERRTKNRQSPLRQR